jgi:hypothetical protein
MKITTGSVPLAQVEIPAQFAAMQRASSVCTTAPVEAASFGNPLRHNSPASSFPTSLKLWCWLARDRFRTRRRAVRCATERRSLPHKTLEDPATEREKDSDVGANAGVVFVFLEHCEILMDYFNRPDVRLALARKLVERLTQFGFVEDRGARSHDGAIVWYPTESGAELQREAQIAARVGLSRLHDDHIHHLVYRGLIEWDRHYRWKFTELAETLLKLPAPLLPADCTSPHTLH